MIIIILTGKKMAKNEQKIPMDNIKAIYHLGFNLKLEIKNVEEVIESGEVYLLKVFGYKQTKCLKNRIEIEKK